MHEETDPDCNRVLALSRSVEARRAIERDRTFSRVEEESMCRAHRNAFDGIFAWDSLDSFG